MSRKLTAKQQKFIEVYDGNGTQAARLAGYQGSDNTLAQAARELLRNPQIAQAIRARESKKIRPHVASREQRQAFWTSLMNDEHKPDNVRLHASDLLARSEGDFIKKIEVKGKLTLEQLVAGDVPNDSTHES